MQAVLWLQQFNTTNISASPTVTGTVVSYGISPALPAGVTLNTTTGVISGTPTVASPLTNYTVTATNGGGSTTATFTLTVHGIPTITTGHNSVTTFSTTQEYLRCHNISLSLELT